MTRMNEKSKELGRKIVQIAESLPERERALLLAFGEGMAAATKTAAAQALLQDGKSA